MTTRNVTVVILAGGLATRLPHKLALPISGEPMLARAVRRLGASGLPCVASIRAAADAEFVESLGVRTVIDEHPGAGPLGALLTAAERLETPLFFAAAADAPNLRAELIERMIGLLDADPSRDAIAVLPTWPDGRVEPLAALYVRDAFIPGAQQAISAGELKVTDALRAGRVLPFFISPEDAPLFANVNTPADYAVFSAHEQ